MVRVLGLGATVAVLIAFSAQARDFECPFNTDQTAVVADSHGNTVCFPYGARSFANGSSITYVSNGSTPKIDALMQPASALGAPNYNQSTNQDYVSLGCRGALTLRFDDVAIVDVEGPDLYVFEIGSAIEPTWLEVSVDGNAWIDIGQIDGATAEVDLAGKLGQAPARFVRLTDLESANCSSDTPGADIDAVGVIGSGIRVSLSVETFFEFDKDQVKPDAVETLQPLLKDFSRLENGRFVVEGHADDTGDDAYNLDLSQRRAAAVAGILREIAGVPDDAVTAIGYGETRPIESNQTEEGRARNRRVEVLILPSALED